MRWTGRRGWGEGVGEGGVKKGEGWCERERNEKDKEGGGKRLV